MRGTGSILVLLACLALAQPAAAGTATTFFPGPDVPRWAGYSGAAGEVNQLTVTVAGATITFEDARSPVAASEGCEQDGPNRAVCRAAPGGVSVNVGDMDDRVRATRAIVRGGPGADTIESGGTLYGQEGDDVLRGGSLGDYFVPGSGSDRVHAGPGDDLVLDTEPAFGDDPPQPLEHDLLDGGPGIDRVDYSARREPGTVDLARGLGHMPDQDELTSIEGAVSGRNGDAFLGGDGPNRFEALASSFQHGRGGDDVLDARAVHQADVLDAGAGDDRIGLNVDSQLGGLVTRDRLRCGPGTDTVEDPGSNALIPADCERVSFLGTPRVRLPSGREAVGEPIAIVVGYCEVEPCGKVSARLRLATSARGDERPRSGATLARTTSPGVPEAELVRMRLRPNARARGLMRRGSCALATLELLGLGTEGEQLILFRFGRRCPAVPPLER